MQKKSTQRKTISEKIIEEIGNQIKSGLNVKEFNRQFHKIVNNSIEEQLK